MDFTMLINGVEVKAPQEQTPVIQDIDADSSGRNAEGDMVRDVITQKMALQNKWGPLSMSEISLILRLINAPFFTVTYPDPLIGGMTTKFFYCGDRSSPVYSWHPKYRAFMWQGLSVNFIER